MTVEPIVARAGWTATALHFAFAAFMLLVGLALIGLGGKLLWLGGSAYYLLAGTAISVSAILIAIRSWRGIWLYFALLAATVAWAFWESGLDGWALAPRLAMFVVMGLWMLAPWSRATMGATRPLPAAALLWSGLAVVIAGSVGYVFWLDQPSGGSGPIAADAVPHDPADGDWVAWGNDQGASRYSSLNQITPANVGRLEPVWSYDSGPLPKGSLAGFEATPLKLGNRLYFCAAYDDVIALDAETGKEIWRFKPHINTTGIYAEICRGVTHYRVPDTSGVCADRIYVAALDNRLIALNSETGIPCLGFGKNGEVNLLDGMGIVERGYYMVTSPPQLVRGRLVLGGFVTDGQSTKEPPGVIRAFDAVTGAFSWAFDIGKPDEHGMPPEGQSFTLGTPNSWAPMSADESLGLVYVPTGNSTPDYYAGYRTPEEDRYSSSVVALDAETGAVRWSFQTTHHDLWDYDVGSQPTLIDLPGGVPALLQATKRGEVFMLDRRTGKPLANVEERPVPQGAMPGEHLAATQPFPTDLPSFAGPPPAEASMWGLTPIDQALCRIQFKEARFDGTMTPLGTERPTVTWPGYLGGIDWGGVAVDRERHLMVVNSTRVGNYNQLMSRDEADKAGVRPMTAAHMSDIGGTVAQFGTPYAAKIRPFLSQLGIPCQAPPYGMISAVDLPSGKVLWNHQFGTSRDSGPFGMATLLPIPMGVPNLGGAVVTAGELFFIGATQEHELRAFDTVTGAELWKARIPAGGQANPATYWSAASNRQFVVMAVGGHGGLLSGSAQQLIAYALPKDH